MEINIEQYIDPDLIKDLAKDTADEAVRYYFREHSKRLIENAVYAVVQETVSELIREETDLQDLIREKTKGVITKLSSFSVFSKADSWNKRQGIGDSLGQQILEEEVAKRRERIGGRVQKLMDEMTYRDVKELVLNSVEQMLFVHEEESDD